MYDAITHYQLMSANNGLCVIVQYDNSNYVPEWSESYFMS